MEEEIETKLNVDYLHTVISEMAENIKDLVPDKMKLLDRYKMIIKDHEANLNESMSLEFKERKINEVINAIENMELVNISNEKNPETQKAIFSNETSRKTELIMRLKKNPDYVKNKDDMRDIEYRKKNLLNAQITNRMWLKYYELEISAKVN